MSHAVLLSIPNTLSTRNLLRSDVLPRLKAAFGRVVIVAPFAREPEFQREFVRDNVVAYPMLPARPSALERILVRALYNLYLSGPSPASLQLFLDRWADNHRALGPIRQFVTRRLLPVARPLMPALDRVLLRTGDRGRYENVFDRERPDIAVFSRLFLCDEIPLMRAAVASGVPTIGVVASWDNLTNKGPLQPRLDRLVVWNELMREEARRYHAYAADDVFVTGAPQHDVLFGDERSRLSDRAAFFARFGLAPSKKLITYAGEDPIIAPDAPLYAEQLHRAIADGRLSQPAQLFVRPHPQDDPRRWQRVQQLPGVCFDLPGRRTDHWMDMSRDDLRRLYETMQHSDVIVNVTSTIVLDAAFFDTPTVCIGYGYSHPKTFYNSPLRFFEMDHYRYIIGAGATRVVESEGELIDEVNACLLNPGRDREGRRRIVREIAQFSDGRSAERIAAVITAAAHQAHQAGEARNTAAIAATGRAI